MTLMHFKVVDDRFMYLKEGCRWQLFDNCFLRLYWDVLNVVGVARPHMSYRPEVE